MNPSIELDIDAWVPDELVRRVVLDARRRKKKGGARRRRDDSHMYFCGFHHCLGVRPKHVADWRRLGRLVGRLARAFWAVEDEFWNRLRIAALDSPSKEVWVLSECGQHVIVYEVRSSSHYDSTVTELVERGTQDPCLQPVVVTGAHAHHMWKLRFRSHRLLRRLRWARMVLHGALEMRLGVFMLAQKDLQVRSPVEVEFEVGGLTHRATLSGAQSAIVWNETVHTVFRVC